MTSRFRLPGPVLKLLLPVCVGALVGAHGQQTPDQAKKVPAKEVPIRRDPVRAEEAFVAGARLLDQRDLAAAQRAFGHAVELDSTRPEYAMALDLTRQHRIRDLVQQAAQARMTGSAARADTLLAEARTLDPDNETVLEHAPAPPQETTARITETPRDFAPPIVLAPAASPTSLHLRGDVRQVVTSAASAYGVKTVYDEGIDPATLRFDIEDAPYEQAMPILLRMAHLFSVPVDPHTILIAKDTQENRQRLERQVEETLYLPAATTEQLNELSNIVKNVFDVRQVVVSPSAGTLSMRAPEAVVKAANYTLADLVDGGAEVSLEIKLISVDKNRTRNTGLQTPTSVGAFSLASEARSIVSANQTLIDQAIASGAFTLSGNAAQDILLEAAYLVLSGVVTDAKLSNLVAIFGGGLTLFGVNLGSATTLNLGLNQSEARALDDITVRIGDRQTTTLRIGSKYPITTSTYTVGNGLSNSTATINGVSVSSLLNQYLGSAQSTTTPIVAYEDLGLTLKTTPMVQKSGLVSLHVDLKIEALTGSSLNNIPLLTSRVFTSDILVAEGSTAVLLSDLSSNEAASVNGIPGLADLPGFQESAADRIAERDSSELVLLVTPHLVRRRSSSLRSKPYPLQVSNPLDN